MCLVTQRQSASAILSSLFLQLFLDTSDVHMRDVGDTGVSWVLQLLVGTCSSAGCVAALEAAGVNYSEMEIDLQHHTQINPPSL